MIEFLWFMGGFIAGIFVTSIFYLFMRFNDDEDVPIPIAHAQHASVDSDQVTIYDLET